ncbi:O-acetylserine/cysteine efflux transporter [Cryobacterium mesophilum]|uniref:DMT family transporter n=1 Tax=Terrimesophilobacter mesophilus TaxID=433647 RepID=A0A4R8VAW4_9MICO|nr:DMT family transporter [Terrimesophilobacter mesophilus]MBB5633347.1 O-acetylserine/cysteine efflux transporter [Terrimesophilobacter mesophilus]TFB80079.1 DMT family transporter [Terrimesophilobacter mesophilus]
MSDQRLATGWVRTRSAASIGALLALLAAASYATVNALLRSVAADVDPFAGSLIRQIPLLVIAMAALIILRPAALRPRSVDFIGPKMVIVLMVAGVVSFLVGNVFLFSGLNWVGLAVATAASQGGIVLGGTLVSALVLREPPTRWQLVGVIVVAVGLAVVASPGFGNVQAGLLAVIGFLLSLAAGVCYTISNAASRTVQRRPRTFITALAMTNLGGIIALTIAVAVRSGGRFDLVYSALTTSQILVLILAGAVNAVALASITLAVRFTTVTAVSALSSLVIVFGIIIAWLVFHENIAVAVIVGAAIIIVGVVIAQVRPRAAAAVDAPDLDFPLEINHSADAIQVMEEGRK